MAVKRGPKRRDSEPFYDNVLVYECPVFSVYRNIEDVSFRFKEHGYLLCLTHYDAVRLAYKLIKNSRQEAYNFVMAELRGEQPK